MGERKRNAATATFGLAGVAGAGALRHSALVDSYGEKGPSPIKRPKSPHPAELRLLKHPAGRGKWLAGIGLGAVSIPPAATGTAGLLTRKRQERMEKRSFVREGYEGTKQSILERNESFTEKRPAKLVAGNYLAGAAIGSGAGALAHRALGTRKIPGTARSAAAAVAGTVAGAASLPVQSKLTRRASHGRYEVTPTGVRRVKPAKVEKLAIRVHPPTMRAGYGPPTGRLSSKINRVAARAGSHWTSQVGGLADAAEGYEPKYGKPSRARKLVRAGRSKAGATLRGLSQDVSGFQDRDKMMRDAVLAKADPGATLSRGERRARVTAAGAPLVVGDFMAAGQAARLAPPGKRKRTAVQQYAGGMAGGLAGNAVGAGAALGAARLSPGFNRRAQAANDALDSGKKAVRHAVGLQDSPGVGERVLNSPKTPSMLRNGARRIGESGIGRAVARNPKVAAIGAVAGGALGGQIGQQATYGHIMTRDDRARAQARRGQSVRKDDKPLSQREQRQLRRRKEFSAGLSMAGGATGIGALGSTVGEHVARRAGRTKLAGKFKAAQVPLLTAGAVPGAVNAFTYAGIQRKESHTPIQKGTVPSLTATGVRRAPAMRRGFIRQTRYPSGQIKVSSVRGGLA